MRPEFNLYDFQKRGKAFIEQKKYVLIADQMGLGKSVQAISTFQRGKQVLVICPAMLKTNWEQEVKKFTNLSVKQVDSKTDYSKKFDVFISSYENVKNIPTDLNPNTIVMDECHYIKNVQAKRTKNVHRYVGIVLPEYLIALSGTPITTSCIEFFSILKLLSLCPSKTNGKPLELKSQYAFNMRFSHQKTRTINVTNRYGKSNPVRVVEYSGIKSKEELKTYLRGKYLRRLASKCLELPKITDVELLVSNKKSKRDELLFGAIESGEKTEHISTVKIESAMEKVPYTLKHVSSLVESGEQVVIFSDHIDPINAISKGLTELKITSGIVSGKQSKFERDSSIELFKDSKLQVLVCSFKAASVGLTLTTARHLVFNDLSWIPSDIEQARKRVHRISQVLPVTITTILGSKLDKRICRRLNEKRKDIREIVSDG